MRHALICAKIYDKERRVMEYELPQLVDVARLRTLADLWSAATGIPLSIIDLCGATLSKSGLRDICLNLCKQAPGQECARSDMRIIVKPTASRKQTVVECRNGLSHASVPITVFGDHAGNYVAGPFFLQPADTASLGRQADQLGIDKAIHLDAVSRVPVIAKAKLGTLLQDFSVIADALCELGARKLTDGIDRYKWAEQNAHIPSPILEAASGAPGVLPGQREEQKSELDGNVLSNVKELILPYVDKLKRSGLSVKQTSIMNTLVSNLMKVTSPAIRKIQTLGLTTREIEVASLLKEGKTTKQIAELLGVSLKAVEFHRHNIRKKLGLGHKKTNLRAYLTSVT
jgi:DNA-binding CsgD family transcriptional regulator/ligand-binding sensor protein